MRKVVLSIALAVGVGFAQTVNSKLKGKRIYLSRQEPGHQGGYDGLRELLEKNKAVYGYEFEYSPQPLPQSQLDAVFSRLYKADGTKPASVIDILIFCQGEGDKNVAGTNFANPRTRMTQVNNHVKNGGVLISVHGSGGREVTTQGWWFGARLMTDWFLDDYRASQATQGNGGHFPSGTKATYTLDEETLPEKDSSAFFIRKLQTLAKAQNGYAQPLVTTEVRSEWYHYNGGKKFEDGTGGAANPPDVNIPPLPVRGNMGVPDSGIGPVKIFGVVKKLEVGTGGYTPPGKGRHSVWGREVSKGVFDATQSSTNGRYVLFNPGHDKEEYTIAGGWMGDFFLSTLRWAVKDDRGCMQPTASNYNALATVNEGCTPSSIGHDAALNDGDNQLGKISVDGASIGIDIKAAGAHSIKVMKISGEQVFQSPGSGARAYQVPGLKSGFYLVQVRVNGLSFLKQVAIL